MVGVVMGDVDALDIPDGAAQVRQGSLQFREGLGRVHSRVEQGQPSLVKKRINLDVLQPEGHGERDAVKMVGNFLHD
jgi:hypothetical protein